MADTRKQINVRLDQETIEAIDELRALVRPIPSLSDMVRDAIIEKRDRTRRRIETQNKGEK